MTQHTPTPWQTYESSPSRPIQIIANVDNSVDGSFIDYDVVAEMGFLKSDYANAAFIVRACNAHDALVEAVLSSQISMKAVISQLKDRGGSAIQISILENSVAVIKKSLKLARGEV